MSRMTVLPPDLPILRDVIHLCDAVDAKRACQPARPQGYCSADDSSLGEPAEISDLREYLRNLSDDHQAQIHATYWLGRDKTAVAEQYPQLYQHALATDLRDNGAVYLSAKAPIGRSLRRGLEMLGLG